MHTWERVWGFVFAKHEFSCWNKLSAVTVFYKSKPASLNIHLLLKSVWRVTAGKHVHQCLLFSSVLPLHLLDSSDTKHSLGFGTVAFIYSELRPGDGRNLKHLNLFLSLSLSHRSLWCGLKVQTQGKIPPVFFVVIMMEFLRFRRSLYLVQIVSTKLIL